MRWSVRWATWTRSTATERQERAQPVALALRIWMPAQRVRATDGTALALALDYGLKL